MIRFAALLFIVCPLGAADDPRLGGPRTYATPSPNGTYLFVMIAPRPADNHPALEPEKESSQKEIYAKYSKSGSGLYRNDGSTQPLWSVDWYSYRVWPADDGVHAVRLHGEFPLTERFPASKRLSDEIVADQVNGPGLSFYANGKLQKMYTVRELVKNVESLPHSLQHVLWSADGVMTKDGKQFCMMTQDARQIFFDLDSAQISVDRQAGLGNEAQVWVVRLSIFLTLIAGSIIFAGWLYRQRAWK